MGISTIAAIVRDQSAQVAAAVSITVPSQKIYPTSLDTLVADIQGAALELSTLLGYRAPDRSPLSNASSVLCAA
jgi:DNA-binding IclR family transcriptional regulator